MSGPWREGGCLSCLRGGGAMHPKGWLHQVPCCAWEPGDQLCPPHVVDRKDGSGCGGIVVLTCRLWRPQTPQPKSLPVLSRCALCLGHLTLSGAVDPELLGHPGLHQELPLCTLQRRSTLPFLGCLMGPAFLRVQQELQLGLVCSMHVLTLVWRGLGALLSLSVAWDGKEN